MQHVEPARLEAIIECMSGIRVVVVGDLMLDVYLRGTVSRVSPEAPVPVVRVRERRHALGGAGNVAANAVSLGARCAAVGCVGGDSSGSDLVAEMTRLGIDTAGVQRLDGRPTTVKTRVLTRHQQVARYDLESTDDVGDDCAAALAEAIRSAAATADAILLEDYNKGALTRVVIDAALDAGRTAGIPVVVDPKQNRFHDYAGATVFKPNRAELEYALGEAVRPDDAAWLHDTRERLGCDHLLVTLGRDGMTLSTDAGTYVRVPALARSVYDVSGAGDTVTAVTAVALAAGADVVEAAILANHAAAVEVARAGVVTVSREALREAISQPRVAADATAAD